MRRYVGGQNPLFDRDERGGTGKFPYLKSAYYLWWRCLRLNEDYKHAIELGDQLSKHEESERFEPLVRDFGDVWATDFEAWWNFPVGEETRGEYLFAEPLIAEGVRRLSKKEAIEFIENWDQKNYMLFAVPVAMYSEEFREESNAIFGQRNAIKGLPHQHSRARYQFTARIKFDGLNRRLAIYERMLAEPETPAWKHAFLSDPAYDGLEPESIEGSKFSDERNELSMEASRQRRRAQQMIEATGYGCFPQLTSELKEKLREERQRSRRSKRGRARGSWADEL